MKLNVTMIAFLLFWNAAIANSGGNVQPGEIITAAHIEHLPAPIQRFLSQSKIVGTPMIKGVELEQKGMFKMALEKSWVPFKSTQRYDIATASFKWGVRMKMAPGVFVSGGDILENGQGSMKIKLYGLIPLVNASGPEMDQGAMTRYLSETIWFPQAFLDDHITWQTIDSTQVLATLTIGEKQVSGIFHFNREGFISAFTCERYHSTGKEAELMPWRTPIDHYSELGGFLLGTRGRAIWDQPEGEFCYIDIEITGLKVF